MENQDIINHINYNEVAQNYACTDSGDVYFYTVDNTSTHVRKKCTNDFNDWVVVYNHFGNLAVLLAGQPPSEDAQGYNLIHHISDFVRRAPEEYSVAVDDQPVDDGEDQPA
jgi:hypothetical protein